METEDIVPLDADDIRYITSENFSAPITKTLNDVRVERLAKEIYEIYLEKGKDLLSKPSLKLLAKMRANKIIYGLTYNDYMEGLIKDVEKN